MKINISRKAFIAFCVALSILIELSACSYINSHLLIDSEQCVSRTKKILNLTEQVLPAILEIDVSLPGPNSAGENVFLKSYQQSVIDLNELVALAIKHTHDGHV